MARRKATVTGGNPVAVSALQAEATRMTETSTMSNLTDLAPIMGMLANMLAEQGQVITSTLQDKLDRDYQRLSERFAIQDERIARQEEEMRVFMERLKEHSDNVDPERRAALTARATLDIQQKAQFIGVKLQEESRETRKRLELEPQVQVYVTERTPISIGAYRHWLIPGIQSVPASIAEIWRESQTERAKLNEYKNILSAENTLQRTEYIPQLMAQAAARVDKQQGR